VKVRELMMSYNIAGLAEQYVEGTREWLYEAVERWLATFDTRMFLLAADPGMGGCAPHCCGGCGWWCLGPWPGADSASAHLQCLHTNQWHSRWVQRLVASIPNQCHCQSTDNGSLVRMQAKACSVA
jgi:hypothetical protein